MSPNRTQFYEFANFRLDPSEKVLLRSGVAVPLTPKVFDTLEILVENTGKLLEKEELMQRIWQDHFVEESNLTSNIKTLRKALGDDASKPRFIETVPRRGYRFIAEVKETVNENGGGQIASRSTEGHSSDSPRSKRSLFAIATVIILGMIAFGFWFAKSKGLAAAASVLSAPFASEKLSTNGKVFRAVISSDGKNVVYTNGIEGKQSVWLRQLDTGNNVEIIPPSDNFYFGLALSPDGNFLYFCRKPRSVEGQADIYRVSIFGGIPIKIIAETQGSTNLSADGAKISFVRCYYRDEEYCSLWIADAADGKHERKLASRPRPIRIGDNEISPYGRSVVFAVGQSENQANEFGLSEVDVESGAERALTAEKFFDIKSLAWLPDGSGLLLTASRIPNKHFRIWRVFAASGEVSPLTDDSESYAGLSLDREASRLVATKSKEDFRLHLLDMKNPSESRVLADASSPAFAPDGKIVFSSPMTGNDEIWTINADGSGQRQLTNDPADDRVSVVSPDGGSVFFSSNRTGEIHVWRMNADGSNQTQITRTTGGDPLFVSPDGKWLYYHERLTRALRRVEAAGGEDQLVLDKRKDRFALSPDGLQVAFVERQDEENVLTIVSVADASIVRTFKLADERANVMELKWSSDGENLAYILAADIYENKTLWFQPLSGKARLKIADLGDERIAYSGFALAQDGKSVAIVKGAWKHDAVLIKGLK
jgi:Tol biopolymer transport system component/DNA-binding winged helix-turn-helix (wHTH) protein